jgi:SAM-dependent methyltransferase
LADLEHVARNVAYWGAEAIRYRESGHTNWSEDPSWGIWSIPESEVGLLPDVVDKDVLEAGCGTGYVSGWIARLGGRPVGLDPTPEQLETARMLQKEFGVSFPLVRGAAETLPFRDGSFDVVVSEYGAAIWADPYMWISEAARVLRPGGELMFLGNAALLMLCVHELEEDDPADEMLKRDYFGMHRFEWPDTDGVEFHLNHGDMVRLLRTNGFEILDLVELRPGAEQSSSYPFVTMEWARRWPSEEVWKARKIS